MKGLQINNILLSRITGLSNTIFSAAIGLVSIPFIISKIELLGYGQWSVVWIFIGIAAFLDLGVSKQLVQNVANSNNKRDKENFISGAKKSIFFIQISIVLIHIFVYLFCYYLIEIDFDYYYFLISLAVFLGTIQFNLYKSLFEGLQKIYISNIYSFLQTLLFYSLSFLAIYANLEISQIILISSSAFVTIPLLMYFHQLIDLKTYQKRKIDYREAYRMYLNSISFFHFNIATGMSIPLARGILFSINPILHGIFDVGLKIGISSQSLLSSLTLHLHAQLRNIRSSKKDIDEVVYKNLLICLTLFLIGNTTFFLFGNSILGFLFNSESNYFWINCLLLFSITSTSVFEPFLRGLWAKNEIAITTKSKYLVIASILFFAFLPSEDSLLNIAIGYSLGLFLSNLYVFYFYKSIIK